MYPFLQLSRKKGTAMATTMMIAIITAMALRILMHLVEEQNPAPGSEGILSCLKLKPNWTGLDSDQK